MQIFTDIYQPAFVGPTFLTIGNLDGMHRGHQQLFHRLTALAASKPTANIGFLTFDPHPLTVLRPEHNIKFLTTPDERIHLSSEYGANFGIACPFTPQIAEMRAVEFMQALTQNYGLSTLVVGPDFALGHGRSGNIDRLREIGSELGYEVSVLEAVEWQSKPVRSSIIRQVLEAGDVTEANDLLGRPYRVTGTVIEGDKRGRTIGVPTANLQLDENRLWPQDGVYATRTTVGRTTSGRTTEIDDSTFAASTTFNSVTNLGMRPTVEGVEHRFETHILDFPPSASSTTTASTTTASKLEDDHIPADGDIYGRTLAVEFIARLRGEERFDSLDALTSQIHRDIEQARSILSASST